MSASVVIDVDVPSITTWGGNRITAEGSLRVEADPRDLEAGHQAIDQLADMAHQSLNRTAFDIADAEQQRYDAKMREHAADAAEQVHTEVDPEVPC